MDRMKYYDSEYMLLMDHADEPAAKAANRTPYVPLCHGHPPSGFTDRAYRLRQRR